MEPMGRVEGSPLLETPPLPEKPGAARHDGSPCWGIRSPWPRREAQARAHDGPVRLSSGTSNCRGRQSVFLLGLPERTD